MRVFSSVVALFFGAHIHQSFNESVLDNSLILLMGVGFGLVLLAVVALVVYALRGTLDVFKNVSTVAAPWQETLNWYSLSVLLMLGGLAAVSIWNSAGETRFFKQEIWTVSDNGPAERDFPFLKGARPHHPDHVLVLENGRHQAKYSYTPQLRGNLKHLEAGSSVRVSLAMGPVGLFRIENVEVP